MNLIRNDKDISTEYDPIETYDGVDLLIKVVEDQQVGNLIDIIITDENMEYMSGSTAVSIMRDWEKCNKIKKIFIISLTAFADEITLNEIKNKGSDLVLIKPLCQSSLNKLFHDLKSK